MVLQWSMRSHRILFSSARVEQAHGLVGTGTDVYASIQHAHNREKHAKRVGHEMRTSSARSRKGVGHVSRQ